MIPGFELLRQLGSGGMGTVYLARQKSLNRHVAIKILNRLDDLSARRRFERESLLAASVTHPNIVFIVDAGTVNGTPYLVQEFVDGCSVADLLRERRLSTSEVCDILEPVTDALEKLHQAGILHRDLKPGNILIDGQGRPLLSDFGLAVCVESGSTLTHSEMVVGTLDYMAPEQRHRLDVDERADQYSLAAVTYEMLTGDKPLGAFKRPSELNPQLPVSVDSVLLRALARDPDDRFADIRDLFSALTKSLVPRERQPVRRQIATIALTAAATALLTFSLVTYRPPQHTTVVDFSSLPSDLPATATDRPADATSAPADSGSEEDHTVDLRTMTVTELRDFARDEGLTGFSGLNRSELEELIKSGGQRTSLPPGWTTELRIDSAGRRYRWYISPEGKSYRSPPNASNAGNRRAVETTAASESPGTSELPGTSESVNGG
jgi:serine/threonine protein kinase